MSKLDVTVGGRPYTLACRNGEEQRLQRLVALVDDHTRTLTDSLGPVGETRLLLMTALLIADALIELQDQSHLPPLDVGAATGALAAAALRLDELARQLAPVDSL